MSRDAVAASPRPVLPVAESDLVFPVRRVYCIGRNYAAHAREMGYDPDREPPFFFMKPADAILPVRAGEVADLPYPPQTANYHHEVEMVVALKSGGRDIPEEEALSHVFGYAVGIDMTRRDLQDEAKALRRPWETAKSADQSGPVGPLQPAEAVGHPQEGAIRLAVDGSLRQDSDLRHMIWSVREQIAILSRFYRLEAGDLIFTGTPDGVGAVERGDTLVASIDGLGEIALKVV